MSCNPRRFTLGDDAEVIALLSTRCTWVISRSRDLYNVLRDQMNNIDGQIAGQQRRHGSEESSCSVLSGLQDSH
jgi:hypothetical protein